MYLERSQSVRYFAHQFSFTTHQVPSIKQQCELQESGLVQTSNIKSSIFNMPSQFI